MATKFIPNASMIPNYSTQRDVIAQVNADFAHRSRIGDLKTFGAMAGILALSGMLVALSAQHFNSVKAQLRTDSNSITNTLRK